MKVTHNISNPCASQVNRNCKFLLYFYSSEVCYISLFPGELFQNLFGLTSAILASGYVSKNVSLSVKFPLDAEKKNQVTTQKTMKFFIIELRIDESFGSARLILPHHFQLTWQSICKFCGSMIQHTALCELLLVGIQLPQRQGTVCQI